jgi:hypothetical protein
MGNDCRISAITPGAGDKAWRIIYVHFAGERDHIGSIIFKIDIDPQTGEYEVKYPKP